ncbi:MAG TPA: hypothetical protein VJT72_15600, partial [Pseudonocardiaceae bacterium]|nr:hypothetical protein [Pseudonocardiaceae bacterium]
MDLEKRPADAPAPQAQVPAQPSGEGCLVVAIRIPVRIVVLVLVVPVRMLWDAFVVGGRFLNDTVLRPVGRGLLWVLAPVGRGLVRLAEGVATVTGLL